MQKQPFCRETKLRYWLFSRIVLQHWRTAGDHSRSIIHLLRPLLSTQTFTAIYVVGEPVLMVDVGRTMLGNEFETVLVGRAMAWVLRVLPLVDDGAEKAGICIVPATWFNLLISSCQPGTFFAVMCLRACLVRWSDLMKRLPHKGQENRFSPVWVRLCLASSSDRAKRLSQPSQVHGKGFSPEKYNQYKNIVI